MKKILFTLVVLLGSLVARPSSAAAQQYLVIVNANNNVTKISSGDLSKIFLKRVTSWSTGEPVIPVDLPDSSGVREAFSSAVHGRSVSAIDAYWQRQIFSGRGVPPVQLASDNDVIAYVRSNADAVGYVHNGAVLGSGVRTLAVEY